MGIIRYYAHQGNLDELSNRYIAFSKLKYARIEAPQFKWYDTRDGSISHHALALFVGKTGYGKSSTVNAFLGQSFMATDAVNACTTVCQSLDFEVSPYCYFTLGDLPGLGESEYQNTAYLKMYRDFLNSASVVIFTLRADMRDYVVDEFAYNALFTNESGKSKIIFALNFCDKIEPIDRSCGITPNSKQLENISTKQDSIQQLFKPTNNIIPYSAATGWNMNRLAQEIVDVILQSDQVIIS